MSVFTEPNKVYMHRHVYDGQAYFYFAADAKGNIPLSFVDYTPNLNKKWNISGQYILRNWLKLSGRFGH
jgi:hypothetical protein